MLVFIKEILGSNPGTNHIVFQPPLVEMWTLLKKLIKDGQSLQFAYTLGSQTMGRGVLWFGSAERKWVAWVADRNFLMAFFFRKENFFDGVFF